MAEVDALSQQHMTRFLSLVKDYPILNNKSNTPEARRQRTDAITALKTRLRDELSVELSEAQVWKKLQNMKSRVKKKAEMRGMGRIVNMKEWEIDYFNFIEGDFNIKILDVKGAAMQELQREPTKTEFLVSECDTLGFSEEDSDIMDDRKPTFDDCGIHRFTLVEPEDLMGGKTLQERKGRLQETEETRDLSSTELRRLVLLEQLKYYRKKLRLTDIQIRRELQREREESAPSQRSD